MKSQDAEVTFPIFVEMSFLLFLIHNNGIHNWEMVLDIKTKSILQIDQEIKDKARYITCD